MNGSGRFIQTQRIDAYQGDGAEQRNTCPVELQERQPAENHAEVHDKEDNDDSCCHGCYAYWRWRVFDFRKVVCMLTARTVEVRVNCCNELVDLLQPRCCRFA